MCLRGCILSVKRGLKDISVLLLDTWQAAVRREGNFLKRSTCTHLGFERCVSAMCLSLAPRWHTRICETSFRFPTEYEHSTHMLRNFNCWIKTERNRRSSSFVLLLETTNYSRTSRYLLLPPSDGILEQVDGTPRVGLRKARVMFEWGLEIGKLRLFSSMAPSGLQLTKITNGEGNRKGADVYLGPGARVRNT